MAKGKLPEEIAEWIDNWFAVDYNILHAWFTKDKNYLLTIQQYAKLHFVSAIENNGTYKMQVDKTVRMMDVPEEMIFKKR